MSINSTYKDTLLLKTEFNYYRNHLNYNIMLNGWRDDTARTTGRMCKVKADLPSTIVRSAIGQPSVLSRILVLLTTLDSSIVCPTKFYNTSKERVVIRVSQWWGTSDGRGTKRIWCSMAFPWGLKSLQLYPSFGRIRDHAQLWFQVSCRPFECRDLKSLSRRSKAGTRRHLEALLGNRGAGYN